MNVLVIGAGATGQIFARHLQDGGAKITFLVREKHREHFNAIKHQGLPLYPLNDGRNRGPMYLRNFDVQYSIDSLNTNSWDQVWFCVPSNALDSSWIGDIANATGDATLVLLSPEGSRRLDIGQQHLKRVVYGYITFIAWQSPLEGEIINTPGGVAYWFPHFTKVPVRGPESRLKGVLETLKRGKMPVVRGSDQSTGGMVQLISSVLMPLVAGLECAGWSFREFSKSKWAKVVAQASFEAYQATGEKQSSFFKALFWIAINPFTLSVCLWFAPLLMPFDFEKYMRFHFMKIRKQTKWILKGMLEDADKKGIPTPNLRKLDDQLR